MLRAGGIESALGENAVVSLTNWYDLGDEVVIVTERPVPSKELFEYLEDRDFPLSEDAAKVETLHMILHQNGIRHLSTTHISLYLRTSCVS